MRKLGMLIIIVIVVLISWFSSKSNTESHVQSDRLLLKTKMITQYDLKHKTKKYVVLDLGIRKVAHFGLYLILGVGGYLMTQNLRKKVIIVFIFAGIDEFHQQFSPGRTGHLQDVIIDSFGGLVGVIITKILRGK